MSCNTFLVYYQDYRPLANNNPLSSTVIIIPDNIVATATYYYQCQLLGALRISRQIRPGSGQVIVDKSGITYLVANKT
ncbi:MAG TPA: hypothetical protein VFP87_16035 [Chitinophagaceae bacterium]|nr:hypothetical protein [Chitinophagaceae bacterium]